MNNREKKYPTDGNMIDLREPAVIFVIVVVFLIIGGFASLMLMPKDGDNWRNELKKEGTKYCTSCHKYHKF